MCSLSKDFSGYSFSDGDSYNYIDWSVTQIKVGTEEKTAHLIERIKNEAPYIPGLGYVLNHKEKEFTYDQDNNQSLLKKILSESNIESLSKEIYFLTKALRQRYNLNPEDTSLSECPQILCETIHKISPYYMDLAERIAYSCDGLSDIRDITTRQLGKDIVANLSRRFSELQSLLNQDINPVIGGKYKFYDFSGGNGVPVERTIKTPVLIALLHDIGNYTSRVETSVAFTTNDGARQTLIALQQEIEKVALGTCRAEAEEFFVGEVAHNGHAFWHRPYQAGCNRFLIDSKISLETQEEIYFQELLLE
ncbi:MAG: hypothetical protein ACT4OY_01170 [Alphaproteobacteria bacterium]